jgi:DNA segregation ATPase FtsK/SpoIIIE-like protein
MDLFDEPVAAAPKVAAAEPIAAADSGESEPEVVLAPQAAGEGSRKISAQLLTDAGNLFVSEQRVAVSMLQKRFALDFGQSCVILDELQELGLIGPYVDGAPRDILMSSEDWLELTGQS